MAEGARQYLCALLVHLPAEVSSTAPLRLLDEEPPRGAGGECQSQAHGQGQGQDQGQGQGEGHSQGQAEQVCFKDLLADLVSSWATSVLAASNFHNFSEE